MERVAIIGAGPGGIAAARWLKAKGFDTQVFESHSNAGGQWDPSNPNSGVWPEMVTNTFLEATRFADRAYPEGTPIYPHNAQVLKYFKDYAAEFGLLENARFGWKLTGLTRASEGYRLDFDTPDGPVSETFPRVVVATGRFNAPVIPPIPGQDSFTGELGIVHTFDYKDPGLYRGKHVIVAGGSISALEIASDLSMLGAASVRLTQRRQRYVNPKMVRGVPIEYFAFNYTRAALCLGPDKAALARNDEEIVMRYAGDPSRYGAPKPHPVFAKAGVTGSQHYLNLVAEGRVIPVPWISGIDGRKVTFDGGDTTEADGIVAGTGFALSLPFLSEDIARTVELTPSSITLDEFTLHPDLPGLAFIGLWSQLGSYPTPLELQARHLAYAWSGEVPRDEQTMRAGVRLCAEQGHHVGSRRQNEMALRFARLCGADPDGQVEDALMDEIRESATTAMMYRLAGPDALPRARDEFAAVRNRYGPDA